MGQKYFAQEIKTVEEKKDNLQNGTLKTGSP